MTAIAAARSGGHAWNIGRLWRQKSRAGPALSERIFAEIDNDVSQIARVTSLIEQFGARHRLPEGVIFHLKLAFDELLTNIISYGFVDGRPHKISASVRLDGDRLQAEIVDDGIAFDPLAAGTVDTELPVEERGIGGLGIHFVRTVMDEVDYRRLDGRNCLKMVKHLPPKPAKQG